jgi:uncharacterized protein DUF6275
MSESAASISSESSPEVSAKPASPKPSAPRSYSRKSRINEAKRVVVENYNEHHDASRTPRLSLAVVHIVSFTEIFDSWKATVGSTVVRGLLYEVTYNATKREITLEVFKRINTERFPA